jgi:hypothetical protein
VARIDTRELTGWKTCGRPRVIDDASWSTGTVLETDCPHYIESQPVECIEETVSWTYRDQGSPPVPGMDVDKVERSTIRLVPADGNWACEACGFEQSSFSYEPRRAYAQLSEQHPDELRRRSMRQEKREHEQVDAATRQAAALEALAEQGREANRVAKLEEELAQLKALLAEQANGHDDEPAPRARPKAKA